MLLQDSFRNVQWSGSWTKKVNGCQQLEIELLALHSELYDLYINCIFDGLHPLSVEINTRLCGVNTTFIFEDGLGSHTRPALSTQICAFS